MTRALRLSGMLLGALVAAELSGVVTSRRAPVPFEVLVASMIGALPMVLFAVALVLVHRAARIINFAQTGIAIGAAFVFLTFQSQRWPYAVCALLALASAVVASVAIDLFLLRRFTDAPRLVATVVTIAAGQIAVALGVAVPYWRFGRDPSSTNLESARGIPAPPASSPVSDRRWRWGVEVLTGDHLVTVVVVVVVLVGLAVFFLRSNAGVAIRGAAENREKAGTIGISTGSLSTITWALSGLLIGLFVLTSLPMTGATLVTFGSGIGPATLLAGLAAAVIGGMEDLPATACASLGLATFTQALYFSTTNGSIVDVVIFVVLAVAMLVRRGTFGRAEAAVSGGWAAAEEIREIPSVLRSHPSVRAARRWTFGLGAVVLLGYPFAMSPRQVVLGGTFALLGIVAVSLVVLTGWGGQISLGQFALVAVGASVGGALASRGWPFLIALAVATVAGAVVAIGIGIPALRLRGLFLAVMTLAFAAVTVTFFLDPQRFPLLNPDRVPRPKLLFLDFSDDRAFYFLALAGLVFALFVARGLRGTRTGRVLIAMRDNERAAQALGLSLVRVRLLTFAVSGALAAFAGMLFASQARTVSAAGYGVNASIQVFLMAVIGGLGSVSGVLTGAVYLACVQLFIHSLVWQGVASGGGVAIVLLFFPSGLGGAAFAARDAFLRRVALRERIFVPSLLGDLRTLEGDDARARLAAKDDLVPSAVAVTTYVLPSDIAEAGSSQRGRGWVYG